MTQRDPKKSQAQNIYSLNNPDSKNPSDLLSFFRQPARILNLKTTPRKNNFPTHNIQNTHPTSQSHSSSEQTPSNPIPIQPLFSPRSKHIRQHTTLWIFSSASSPLSVVFFPSAVFSPAPTTSTASPPQPPPLSDPNNYC